MNGQAITFDFHNTLAACPEWFELEVRTLPSSFLSWWADQSGLAVITGDFDEADRRYRELRRDIMEHGNELTAEACLAQVFADMQLDVPGNGIESGVAHLMREALAGASPIPGAVETVRELNQTGVPIGVVSSAVYHPFLEWTLEAFGMRDSLQVVITSASAGFYKSRPEIFLHAAEALGADPRKHGPHRRLAAFRRRRRQPRGHGHSLAAARRRPARRQLNRARPDPGYPRIRGAADPGRALLPDDRNRTVPVP